MATEYFDSSANCDKREQGNTTASKSSAAKVFFRIALNQKSLSCKSMKSEGRALVMALAGSDAMMIHSARCSVSPRVLPFLPQKFVDAQYEVKARQEARYQADHFFTTARGRPVAPHVTAGGWPTALRRQMCFVASSQ